MLLTFVIITINVIVVIIIVIVIIIIIIVDGRGKSKPRGGGRGGGKKMFIQNMEEMSLRLINITIIAINSISIKDHND
jgi:hypothetical protein